MEILVVTWINFVNIMCEVYGADICVLSQHEEILVWQTTISQPKQIIEDTDLINKVFIISIYFKSIKLILLSARWARQIK